MERTWNQVKLVRFNIQIHDTHALLQELFKKNNNKKKKERVSSQTVSSTDIEIYTFENGPLFVTTARQGKQTRFAFTTQCSIWLKPEGKYGIAKPSIGRSYHIHIKIFQNFLFCYVIYPFLFLLLFLVT